MDPLLHPPFPSCALVPLTAAVSAPFVTSATTQSLETARSTILRDGGRVTAAEFATGKEVLQRADVATTLSVYETLRGGATKGGS